MEKGDSKAVPEYVAFCNFILEKTEADAVIVTILGGNKGSASVITVDKSGVLVQVPAVLDELKRQIQESLIKPSMN